MSEPASTERADHYRQMAQDTHDLAARTHDPEIRAGYLALAQRWTKLAERAGREDRSFTSRNRA